MPPPLLSAPPSGPPPCASPGPPPSPDGIAPSPPGPPSPPGEPSPPPDDPPQAATARAHTAKRRRERIDPAYGTLQPELPAAGGPLPGDEEQDRPRAALASRRAIDRPAPARPSLRWVPVAQGDARRGTHRFE